MVRVQIRTEGIDRLTAPGLIAAAEVEMIDAGVDVLVPIARAEAPRRTGKGAAAILGSVDASLGGRPTGHVHAGKAFYLRILATGAKAHSIAPFRFKAKSRARRAARALGPAGARGAMAALRFQIGGAYLFRSRVQHPGLRADDFFARAAQRGEPDVEKIAERIVQRALDRAANG